MTSKSRGGPSRITNLEHHMPEILTGKHKCHVVIFKSSEQSTGRQPIAGNNASRTITFYANAEDHHIRLPSLRPAVPAPALPMSFHMRTAHHKTLLRPLWIPGRNPHRFEFPAGRSTRIPR